MKIFFSKRNQEKVKFIKKLAEFSMAPKFQKSDDSLYLGTDRAEVIYNGFISLLELSGYSEKEARLILQDVEYEPVLRVDERKKKD